MEQSNTQCDIKSIAFDAFDEHLQRLSCANMKASDKAKTERFRTDNEPILSSPPPVITSRYLPR